MRLIDADALLEKLIKTPRYFSVKFDIEEAPTIEITPQMAHAVLKRYCERLDIGIQQAWNYLESEVEKR